MQGQDPFQPGTESRLLLAIVLSMAVLILTPYLYQKLYPPPPEVEEPRESAEPTRSRGAFPQTVTEAPFQSPLQAPSEVEDPTATEAQARVIEVENADLVLRWNSRGAVLESALLKHYLTAEEGVETEQEQKFLEMIPQQLPDTFPKTLAIRVPDEGLQMRLSQAVCEVLGAPRSRIQAPAEITFLYRGEGVEMSRRLRIPAAGYALEVETEVWLEGQRVPFALYLGAGIGDSYEAAKVDFANPQAAYYSANSVERYQPDDLEEGVQQLEVAARWVAIDSQYFSYLILGFDEIRAVRFQRDEWQRTGPEDQKEAIPLLSAEVALKGNAGVSLFIGPKDHNILGDVDPSLIQLIDYGFLAFLVRPLVIGLKFIYRYINNYAFSIIILTFLINLVLFPLRYKQMVSMKKMSAIQPQIKNVQEKFKRMKKDDPRRKDMNAEVMGLYKQHGVNPLGGCLPLVIQMPFLFAFYSMLANSIELRGAPFLWIQDLARPDVALTILMGLSMIIQQKMTPGTSADPTQRRMMMFLPIVFTFMFLSFSSGLVLYFLFSNLFAMMLQILFQKWNPELAPAKAKKKK